jgi:hypothetical protein
MMGSLVTCEFNITNEAADQYLKLQPADSLTIDDSGNQYGGYKVMTSELSNVGREGLLLVSKVPVKAKLMIEGVTPNAKSLALLKLKFCNQCGWSSEEVQFRQVPLFKIE